MPSKSSQINRSLRIEAGGEDGNTDMRQLIMELARAQSAAALPAPAMPALLKSGGMYDRQASLRAARSRRLLTRE